MGRFFENLAEKANGIFTRAQDVAEATCDRFKLEQDIKVHKKELDTLFIELGRLSYHGNAQLAGVRPKQAIVDDIVAISSKISSLEEELEELTNPSADEEPVIEPEPEPTPNSPAKCFCHKCGQPQDDEDLFCNKCGAKLKR